MILRLLFLSIFLISGASAMMEGKGGEVLPSPCPIIRIWNIAKPGAKGEGGRPVLIFQKQRWSNEPFWTDSKSVPGGSVKQNSDPFRCGKSLGEINIKDAAWHGVEVIRPDGFPYIGFYLRGTRTAMEAIYKRAGPKHWTKLTKLGLKPNTVYIFASKPDEGE